MFVKERHIWDNLIIKRMEFASYINYYVEYYIFWIFCICCIHLLHFLIFKLPTNRHTHSICYVMNSCFSELFTKQEWKDRKQEKEKKEERAKNTNGKESTEERERDEGGEGKGRREVTEGKKH